MVLHFGNRSVRGDLPRPAFGLTRFTFDSLLLNAAVQRGAVVSRESEASVNANIIATGRTVSAPRGRRIFGFKAHFAGPVDDAIELFFFERCYVGVNTVESGITNVCGLGPEDELLRVAFDIDALLATCRPLSDRLGGLRRTMDWMHVGPLVFRNQLNESCTGETYFCGDALSFVDPFTGSGLLSAVITGEIAGRFAAAKLPVVEYVRECSTALRRPFLVSSVFRAIAQQPFAGWLACAVPPEWLFRWTRPLIHA
jgi:hypothetical protein